MSDVSNYVRDRSARDSAFAAEYARLEPEYAVIRELVDARVERGMTLGQLAEATGICASNISRIESGNANPTLRTLQRLADGLGKRLEVHFI